MFRSIQIEPSAELKTQIPEGILCGQRLVWQNGGSQTRLSHSVQLMVPLRFNDGSTCKASVHVYMLLEMVVILTYVDTC